ncbi:hypothetical protein [Haloquadratum walsbyi]|jgi:hypothetical protein|uniref:Uncharacterized protein n=1 Tax=Haloquadratum walsbyi J07HQW2 TaxID=1238425 RepID=U1N224_9EURY|nr:hypothetical protein [Haloquadratum walsbyi]ERG96899.1 MAG: hypothetical protein J07HQW2_03383 [Haloquadratum walsbyi J07HQW2]
MRPNNAAADPSTLSDELPDAPTGWQRSDATGGIIEYRYAGDDGVCAVAKLSIRPDLLGSDAVRVDPKRGCSSGETRYYESVDAAVDGVTAELRRVSDLITEDSASHSETISTDHPDSGTVAELN